MNSVIQDMNPVLQMLTVMSLFSLLPFVFCCMTCFLRFTIVFSLLKTAMGVQVPPAIVRFMYDFDFLYNGRGVPTNV